MGGLVLELGEGGGFEVEFLVERVELGGELLGEGLVGEGVLVQGLLVGLLEEKGLRSEGFDFVLETGLFL